MTPPGNRSGWRRLDGVDWSMAIFVVLVCVAASGIRGSGRDLNYWAKFIAFAGRFFPPDWSVLPDVGWAMLETARIALVATAVAAVASLPLALAASRTVSPWWVAIPARLALNAVRSIPSLVWAVLAVAITGPNSLAGCIALSGYSAGYLAKFFSESIDAADQWPSRSLRAMGANAIQAFRWGTWPQLRTQLASHGLWMLEYNLRSAAIVGYVGAGGVGLLLQTYQEYGNWDRFGVVLLTILGLVTLIDWAGQRVRRLWNPGQQVPADG